MRHLVCFNFLPKRRLSCPKGPRSHGFCGLTEAQAALNYVARSCLKSEGQQSFIPLAPHSWLRHIDSACVTQRLRESPLLRAVASGQPPAARSSTRGGGCTSGCRDGIGGRSGASGGASRASSSALPELRASDAVGADHGATKSRATGEELRRQLRQ